MKNKILIIGFALIFILAFLFFYITMDLELYRYYEGGVFSEEIEISEEVEIVIGGKKQNNLFSGSVVYGTYRIMGGKYYDFEMTQENDLYQGTIYFEDENGKYIKVGKIAASEDIYKVWAHIDEYDEKYGVETFIAAPASDLEEGKNIRTAIFGE